MLRGFFFIVFVVAVLAVAGGAGYFYWRSLQPRESIYDPTIVGVARNNGVDPFLIRALIWRESRFDPLTHGMANEHGLMQVTPDVGQMWAKANKVENFTDDDLYDPETNIRAGTWYLKRAMNHWSLTDDPVTFALAEYNAGRSNAAKWVDPMVPLSHSAFINRITYPGTRLYVEKIEAKRDEYRTVFADNRWYKEPTTNAPAAAAPTNAPAP